ncbi:MAG: hypothetical protein CM1200mP28_17160 [Deltaproteobacteria bacterium]|nr:MAG: hypothetical protein CM1200mP28_17160 [Deltaproteobacteria bacterium]
MRVSSSTIILFFNLLLGGISSYIGGSLLSTWLHHEVLSISDSTLGRYTISTENLPIDSLEKLRILLTLFWSVMYLTLKKTK